MFEFFLAAGISISVAILFTIALLVIIEGRSITPGPKTLHRCSGKCGTLISNTKQICTSCLKERRAEFESTIKRPVTRKPVIAIDAKEAYGQAEEAFMHKW